MAGLLTVALVALIVWSLVDTGADTAPDQCPRLGPLEDVNYTSAGVAEVRDNTGQAAEIDLNLDYSACKDPTLTALQANLRVGFAHGEAVLCGQREAYVAGTYKPPASLGLKEDPQTRSAVATALADKCQPQKFKDTHWGISLEDAAK